MAEGAGKNYETQDLSARALGWFGVGLAVLAVLTLLGMAGLLRLFSRDQVEMAVKAERPGEAMPAAQLRQAAPGPKLQVSPARDLQEMRALEDSQLHDYGWVDRQAGTAAIPIERAMELVARRGLTLDSGDNQTERADKERK